jgi:hypothetical protein
MGLGTPFCKESDIFYMCGIFFIKCGICCEMDNILRLKQIVWSVSVENIGVMTLFFTKQKRRCGVVMTVFI